MLHFGGNQAVYDIFPEIELRGAITFLEEELAREHILLAFSI